MKKAYTIDQQIARLKSNGMTFDDEEKAKEILLDEMCIRDRVEGFPIILGGGHFFRLLHQLLVFFPFFPLFL